MRSETFSLSCDTSHYAAADLSFYKAHGGLFGNVAANTCKIIDLSPGFYKVTLKVSGREDGDAEESAIIDVPSGKLVIGDSRYMFSDGEVETKMWLDFIKLTNIEWVENKYVAVRTSNFGKFDVTVNIESVP